MRQEDLNELVDYIETLRPIIYINHFDFDTVDKLIKEAKVYIEEDYKKEIHFDEFNGSPKSGEIGNLSGFLEGYDDASDSQITFLVLKDVHKNMDNPEIIARLKSMAFRTLNKENTRITIFFVCSVLVIPPELEKIITIFDILPPTDDEIADIIDEYKYNEYELVKNELRGDLVLSLKGLSEFEIRQILSLAARKCGTIKDHKDIKLVLKEKEQIIKKSGILEIIETSEEKVGGLSELQKYLNQKAKIFSNLGKAKDFGVDMPKGVLIVGMPGCGKSLTAKAAARTFDVPLLRLDIGKLMGKYVGESESNLRRAIRTAEAVSPCILWIDELEKAFAGVGGQGGGSEVTTRIFGQFLTWMQEKETAVYVVATSNDVSSLPPEFLRKGRFDELFQVNLPTAQERKAIFEIHLLKRHQQIEKINFDKLVEKTDGYSGADVEAVVKEAVEAAFLSETNEIITTENLFTIINNTKSISDTMKEKIGNLKKAYKEHEFKSAN
jgi:ATP-dependent 26S proteasome regulatory subunit